MNAGIVEVRPGMRWVSCARELDWSTSRFRHLIYVGADTTLCGATGFGQGVWRGNSTKPPCPSCLKVEVNRA